MGQPTRLEDDFSLRKRSSRTKRSDLQSPHRPFISPIRPIRPWGPPSVKQTWIPWGSRSWGSCSASRGPWIGCCPVYTKKPGPNHPIRSSGSNIKGGSSGDKLKAKSLNVYRGRSFMECYNFCQQCEDYFATAGATGPNRIPFAASFLRDWINFRWQQYKKKLEGDSSVPITWEEFKVFLQRALGDSRAFVNSYWAEIKRDSQYQLEEVLDWAAHLEHLQAVLKEFDPIAAPNKETLIC